jgi:four helix bundle protein
MPRINSFKDFDGFKKSREFVQVVGNMVRNSKCNQHHELVHQFRRSSISVLSNFAEGYEREGTKEFIQFLAISKGSVGEARAQLIYALDQVYISPDQYEPAEQLGEESSRLIGGLMKYLAKSDNPGRKFSQTSK